MYILTLTHYVLFFFPAVKIMYWLLVSEYSEQDTVKADNLKLGICYILYVLYG